MSICGSFCLEWTENIHFKLQLIKIIMYNVCVANHSFKIFALYRRLIA